MDATYRSPAAGDQEIYRKVLRPDGEIRGGVLALHGWGDHVGTHGTPLKLLTDAGFLVVGFDWPGNGRSSGKRGHLPGSTMTAIALIAENLDYLKGLPDTVEDCPDLSEVGLYAHSTGCFFALSYLAEYQVNPFSWIWLSSPLLRADHGQPAWKIKATNWIAQHFPSLTFDTGVRANDTRAFTPTEAAKAVSSGFYKDCHHRISAELGADLMHRSSTINDCAKGIIDPTKLILTEGADDHVCPPEYARDLFDHIPTSDKTFVLLEELRHEPFNDPNNQEFVKTVRNWLQKLALTSLCLLASCASHRELKREIQGYVEETTDLITAVTNVVENPHDLPDSIVNGSGQLISISEDQETAILQDAVIIFGKRSYATAQRVTWTRSTGIFRLEGRPLLKRGLSEIRPDNGILFLNSEGSPIN